MISFNEELLIWGAVNFFFLTRVQVILQSIHHYLSTSSPPRADVLVCTVGVFAQPCKTMFMLPVEYYTSFISFQVDADWINQPAINITAATCVPALIGMSAAHTGGWNWFNHADLVFALVLGVSTANTGSEVRERGQWVGSNSWALKSSTIGLAKENERAGNSMPCESLSGC